MTPLSPLFKKLVDGYTFGELEKRQDSENKNTKDKEDLYPIIRKGKIIGWQKI